MLTTKIKLGAMVILLFGCVVTAAGFAIPQAPVEKQPENQSQASAPAGHVKNEQVRKDRYGDPLPPGAIARFGTLRFRQRRLTSVVFTRDGKTAIAGYGDGFIIYWDVATGREVRRLPEIGGYIGALAISHDGKTLACENCGQLYLWEVASGKLLSQAPRRAQKGFLQQMLALVNDNDDDHIHQMRFSPDDKTLALLPWGNTIYLWDVTGNKKLHELKGHKGNQPCMALSPDSKTLAAASMEDPHIRLWDIATGREKRHFAADNKGVVSLAFSPDGKTLASIGNQPSFAFFDANTGERLRTVKDYSGGLKEVVYAPDGKILLGIDERTVQVLDAVSGKHLRKFDAPRRSMARLTISPDGKTAATVMNTGGSSTFDLWDVAAGKPLHSFAGHRSRAESLAFSADGATLFSSSLFDDSSGLLIWDATTSELRGQIDNIPVNRGHHYALSPDGKLLAAGCSGSPRLLDPVSRKTVRMCDSKENECLESLVWSADSKTLVSGTQYIAGEETIHVWDAATGRRRCVIKAKTHNVGWIALSPDGALVAGGDTPDGGFHFGESASVHLWETTSGKKLRQIAIEPKEAMIPVAFSPAGTVLAGGGNSISLWEPATGRLLRRLNDKAYSLAFSSDGRTLVSARYLPATVRLWETATGKERASFAGHKGAISTLAISRDGRRVASSSEDTTIVVWDATCGARPDAALSAEQLKTLWLDLIDDDAGRAYRALWQMALAPKKALPFLAERLQPAVPLDQAQRNKVDRLFVDLGSDRFAVRRQSEAELEKMGGAIEPALREALENKPSLEVRRRIEKVLEKPTGWSGERVRALRALEAIEHMNTPEARRLLEALSGGVPRAWLTEEARAICKRQAEQPVRAPER